MSAHRLTACLLTPALVACTPPRLQTSGEFFNELSKGHQQTLEAQCPKDGVAAVDCKRRLREEFEDLRKKNNPNARP